MTVSSQSSSIQISTGGSVGSFSFPFIGVSASDIVVSSVASNGSITPLLSSQYSVTLNAANPNSLWGVGGQVLLNSTPSYPGLIIERVLPLTQQITTQNQGNYYSQVTEQALDLLEMQLQQVSNRTTQFRGTWTTDTDYNVGDVTQDGVNGNDTLNYYICNQQNTSGVWATDLANGYWALSVLAVVPSANQPITLSGAVSGGGTTSIITGFPAGVITSPALASGAIGINKIANMPADSVICNISATSASPINASMTQFNSIFGALLAAHNLSDLTSLPSAISNLGFSTSTGNNGYVKLPGGLVIQWGITANSPGAGGSIINTNFPTTYPNAIFVVMITEQGAGSYGYGSSGVTAQSTTAFTILSNN